MTMTYDEYQRPNDIVQKYMLAMMACSNRDWAFEQKKIDDIPILDRYQMADDFRSTFSKSQGDSVIHFKGLDDAKLTLLFQCAGHCDLELVTRHKQYSQETRTHDTCNEIDHCKVR